MQRRDFFKAACAAGLCSCSVTALLAGEQGAAPATPAPSEDWRIAFAKARYSKLVSTVADHVDEATFLGIIEEVGRFCGSGSFASKFDGDLEGFLAEARQRWKAEATHDPESHVVRLSFRAGGDCACPLMGKGLVPAAACQCSVGSIRQMFTSVMKRPVECSLQESVLQGGEKCAFEVRLGAPV